MLETISHSLPIILALIFSFLFWAAIRIVINSLFYDKKRIKSLEDEVERLNSELEAYKREEFMNDEGEV